MANLQWREVLFFGDEGLFPKKCVLRLKVSIKKLQEYEELSKGEVRRFYNNNNNLVMYKSSTSNYYGL